MTLTQHKVNRVFVRVFVGLLSTIIFGPKASALSKSSQEALPLFEERLTTMADNDEIKRSLLEPLILVESRAYYQNSAEDLHAAILGVIQRSIQGISIRVCEPCLQRRVRAEGGVLIYEDGAPDEAGIRAHDLSIRGDSPAATAAIYIAETHSGFTVRIVSLANARVLFADTFTASMEWSARSIGKYSRRLNLQRQARGDSLTYHQWDIGIFPGQHIAYNFLEQWGDLNQHLSGITVSFVTPVLGIGAAYYRAFPSMANVLVGGKVILSIPKAISEGVGGDDNDSDEENLPEDSLVNFVGVARVPIPTNGGNFGLFAFVSLSGSIGLGVSF